MAVRKIIITKEFIMLVVSINSFLFEAIKIIIKLFSKLKDLM